MRSTSVLYVRDLPQVAVVPPVSLLPRAHQGRCRLGSCRQGLSFLLYFNYRRSQVVPRGQIIDWPGDALTSPRLLAQGPPSPFSGDSDALAGLGENCSSETTQWLPGPSRVPGSLGCRRQRGGPGVKRAALRQRCPGAELTWGSGRQLPGNLAAREAWARSSRGLARASGTRAGTTTCPTPGQRAPRTISPWEDASNFCRNWPSWARFTGTRR